MKSEIEKAYGKLNLALEVLGRRDDGYHDMRMIMQSVEFSDELTVTLNREDRWYAASNLRYIPSDDRNIALKAARLFFEELGEKNVGVDIFIKKNIPVCAGMGGGSSDGAAVLRALNRMTGKPFDAEKLRSIAEDLGSDVPFCVRGGTVLAQGRGELLVPTAPLPDCFIVICKPKFSVSTPKLFSRLDESPCRLRPDIDGMINALEAGSLRDVAQRMFNVFESALSPAKEIEKIKSAMLDKGALGSVMTGTGSAVFGLFETDSQALDAVKALLGSYTDVLVTRPVKALEI